MSRKRETKRPKPKTIRQRRPSNTVRIPRANIEAVLIIVAPKIVYDHCLECAGPMQRSSPPFVIHHPECAAGKLFLAVQELLQP